jgi:hypothetical protein
MKWGELKTLFTGNSSKWNILFLTPAGLDQEIIEE